MFSLTINMTDLQEANRLFGRAGGRRKRVPAAPGYLVWGARYGMTPTASGSTGC